MTGSDRDAEFSAFVRQARVDLVRSACLLTAGDRHLAEDLVQTALARLYVRWPRVRRTTTPLAYARRTVVNAFLDETRRARWRRERSVAEPGRHGHGVLVGPEQGSEGADVRAALAALAPGMRAVVVLRFWLDLSVEETASLLGCSSGTVKSQTAKATSRLRDLLSTRAVDFAAGPAPGPIRDSIQDLIADPIPRSAP